MPRDWEFAREWDRLEPVGVVYDRHGRALPELHLCTCGQSQRRCDEGSQWVCEAPGHLRHACGASP